MSGHPRTIQVLSIASVCRTITIPDGITGSDEDLADQMLQENEDLENAEGTWTIVRVDQTAISMGDIPTLAAPASLMDDLPQIINNIIPR